MNGTMYYMLSKIVIYEYHKFGAKYIEPNILYLVY